MATNLIFHRTKGGSSTVFLFYNKNVILCNFPSRLEFLNLATTYILD